MPPGTSAILGTPLLFMTVQLALGTPPWVPRAIGDRSLSKATIGPAMRRIAAGLIARHPLLRQRLQSMVAPPAVRFIGVISSLLALIPLLTDSIRQHAAGLGDQPAGARHPVP